VLGYPNSADDLISYRGLRREIGDEGVSRPPDAP